MKFTAIDINAIGEMDAKYGQRYWGRVEESQMPVSFNLMTPVDIPIGAGLEFEERLIKETGPQSKNPGSEYLFLRKVKVGGGIPYASTSPIGTIGGEMGVVVAKLDEIIGLLKKDAPKSLSKAWEEAHGPVQPVKDTVVDYDIGEDPVDTSTIPF